MPTEIENKKWDEMIEQKIFVFDDLVQPDHVKQLSGLITATGWTYGQYGNSEASNNWDQHWGYHFMSSALPCKQSFGVYDLWKGIQHIVSDRMRLDLTLINVYAIGTTTDRVGFSHTDWTPALEHWTALYYVNPDWETNWGGETVFYNDAQTDILKSVMPKPGRFVVFNASIPHRSSPPTSLFRGLRTAISFKLIQNKFAYQGLEVKADYKAAPLGSKDHVEREELLKGW